MATKNRVKVTNQNESWFSLAKRFLQDEGKAGQLAKANPGVYAIKKGMTIKLPTVKNTGWQGGFRVPTGSGDITGQYPKVQQTPRPSAVEQASFNPHNFVRGAALAPATGQTAAMVAQPMAAPTGLPVNEDDYIPGQVPGTFVPGVGRVPTPGKLPGVGPKVPAYTPSLPGYIPQKQQSIRLPVPASTQTTQQAFAPAFISGAAQGAATVPSGYTRTTTGVAPIAPNPYQFIPQAAQAYVPYNQTGLSPASPYLGEYALDAAYPGAPGPGYYKMMSDLAAGRRPKVISVYVQNSLGVPSELMIASGYVFENGLWVDKAAEGASEAPASGSGGGGSSGRLRSSTGTRRGGGGGGSSGGGSGYLPNQQGYGYVNPALLGLVSWRI